MVKKELYNEYHFELSKLFKDNEREFPFTPGNLNDADRLEINSRSLEYRFENASLQKKVSKTLS